MSSETVLKCYRGACNAGADVRGYNRVTHGLYCLACARKIDRASPSLSLFPLLNTFLAAGGIRETGLVMVRPAQVS